MKAVIDAVRRICERWAATRTDLIADAHTGDTSIQVVSTRRFKVGEQFLIYNDNPAGEDMENDLFILGINGRSTIYLGDKDGNSKGLKWNWPLSAGAHALKTIAGQRIQAVYFGEPDIITNLPAITVSAKSRKSEFYTLRATKERFDIEIGVFVSADSQEEGDIFLQEVVEIIQYGLKRNFYPLLNDYGKTTLIADAHAGDTFIKVASVMPIQPPCELIIEDQYNIDVQVAVQACDANTIQLALPLLSDYQASQAFVIKPNRLTFNSWPTDITFGKIYKGTLLKSAVISWFVEETEDHADASFGDPQLR